MEKAAAHTHKSKSKILRFLPKAAQATFSFQNPPFSPTPDTRPDVNSHKLKTHLSKGFSGPMISMIPAEARGKSKNFETQEPTSPKVSCIGQVKHKHKNKIGKKKQASLPREFGHMKINKTRPVALAPKLKNMQSGIKKIFSARRKSDASVVDHCKPPPPDRAPSLSQMRRFASSRDAFANFDWTAAQIAPAEERDFYSNKDGGYSDGEDDVVIPFSAPIPVAGDGLALQPRKEINLWKRRTRSQPKPLQLNMVRAQ